MELAFNTGDVVYVYGDMDEDGFYMGEINSVRGLVPSNFLSEAVPGVGGMQDVNMMQRHVSRIKGGERSKKDQVYYDKINNN